MLLTCLTAASFVLACQGNAEDPVARCLKQLQSDNASERDRATQELKQMDYAKSTLLKDALGKEKDPEVRSRLLDVTKHLASKEGERLWGEGKLQPALLQFAEADGATKPEEYVRERLQRTEKEVVEAYREDEQFLGKRDVLSIDRRVVEQYGRWVVPLLLEELGKNGAGFRIPTVRLLEKMESDVVPPLCESLRSSNAFLQTNALVVLKRMPGSYWHPKLPSALEYVISDTAAEERTKETAKELLHVNKLLPKKQDK